MSESEQLSLIVQWEGVCHLMFDLCHKMPKRVRFSFVHRLEGGTLDLLTKLYSARYQRHQTLVSTLQQVDAQLAQLKALSRIAHGRQLLSHGDYERLSVGLDEAGRMLGGWIKSSQQGHYAT